MAEELSNNISFQKTQLLCTFTRRNKLQETIDEIIKTYNIVFNKIYVLENCDTNQELMCTYNIEFNDDEILKNTISIHRKKNTNSLYTINALNEIVSLLNDGKIDPTFEVDWEKFRNNLLITDDNGLKKIKTRIHKIINL